MSQTSAPQSGGSSNPEESDHSEFQFQLVDESGLLAASHRLAEASAGGDRDAGKRFLSAARTHGIDLSNFWASCDPTTGRVREVALGVPGSGRTAMFFTSPPKNREAEEEVGVLIDRVCGEFVRRAGASGSAQACTGIRLAQTLLNPGERAAARAFEHGGFRELARLAYLSRPLPLPSEFDGIEPWRLPDGIRATALASLGPDESSIDARLLIALSRSYEQTLDCPDLCRLRSPEDVLESHRSVRKFDPRWWWLIELNGEPEGVMLFTANPEQGDVELVYLGLSPKLRGKGIAGTLMRSGMRELAYGLKARRSRGTGKLCCAVDLANEPARRLYRGLGFQMTAERVAMVRPLGH